MTGKIEEMAASRQIVLIVEDNENLWQNRKKLRNLGANHRALFSIGAGISGKYLGRRMR